MNLSIIKNKISICIRRLAEIFLRYFGRDCLTRENTKAILAENNQIFRPGTAFNLEKNEIITSIEIRPSGLIRVNKSKILYVDFGNRWALCDAATEVLQIDRTIALWSHKFLGYYHWIVDVLPKICFLKDSLGSELSNWTFCYPKVNAKYEDECLKYLGIDQKLIVDTRKGISVKTSSVIAIPSPAWHTGNPNIGLLRKHFQEFICDKPSKKYYISRKLCDRRVCINDDEVVELVKKYGFEIIEEKSRSVQEQASMFSQASIVVSPHGGAMSNMVWCEPGTLWIELANSSYYPPFFKGLAESCGILYKSSVFQDGKHHKANVSKNIFASISDLEKIITKYVKI